MLGVVEHEEQLAPAKHLRERLERVLAHDRSDTERARDRLHDELRVAYGCERDEPRPVREERRRFSRGLCRETRLPRAPGTREHEQAQVGSNEERVQLAEFAFPSHQRVRRQRETPLRLRRRAKRKLRVLLQDQPLQFAQLAARREPELVTKASTEPGVHLERFRLPAAAEEGEHRLTLQTLAKRMRSRQTEQLRQQLLVAAQAKFSLNPVLQAHGTQLLQPLGLAASELLVGELPERDPTPQGERAPEYRVGERGIAVL